MRTASILQRKPIDPNRATARVSRAVLARAANAVVGDRGCCFIFHRGARAADWRGQPNRGFHIDLHYLEKLIGHLQRTGWDIVTMDEAMRRVAQPGRGRFVNFSIDDGYRDSAELVVPLFRRMRAPVTLYITTGIPDGTMRLRNAGLETILLNEQRVSDGEGTYDIRTRAAKRTAFAALSHRWDHPEGDVPYEQFCVRHGYSADSLDEQHRLTWAMLRFLRDDDVVEIGAHTMSHPRLAGLDPAAALAELVGCRERLEAALGRPVRHFAYPFGRRGDCGARDFALARDAGFASAATTRKGLVAADSDPFCLPRNTLNGEHRALPFAYAHLSGASSIAARMLGRG